MRKSPKTVVYYQNSKKEKPAKEFIEELDEKAAAKVLASLTYLGEHWFELKRPLVEYLGDDIYELRVKFSPKEGG